MMSQILTELPMHLLVFACGAFGYLATRWINDRIYPRVVGEFQDDLQTEEEVVSKAMQKDETVDASTAIVGTLSMPMEPKLSPCPPDIRREELGCFEGGVEFPCGGEFDSKGGYISERDGMPDRAVQVIPRTADSKARRNGEQFRTHIEGQPFNVELARQEQSCQMVNEEPLPAVCSEDEAVPRNSHNGKATEKYIDSADIADISTADESQFSWDVADTDSSWEGEDMDEFVDSLGVDSHSSVWSLSDTCLELPQKWAYQSTWSGRQRDSWIEDDGWMLSFDDILQRRAASTEHVCEPVFSADGGQLFTDGGQYFFLTCESGFSRECHEAQMLPPPAGSYESMPDVRHHGHLCNEQRWDIGWGRA